MTTTSPGAPHAGVLDMQQREPHVDAPILVASDGTDASRPAIEAALHIRSQGAPPRIVAVVPESADLAWRYSVLDAPVDSIGARRAALLLRVKAQLLDVAGVDAEWPIEIRVGDPVDEITQCAVQTPVRLIVLGVEHRHLTDRVLAREVAIRVVQSVQVPMLMVPAGFAVAPARMMLATDFSAASIHAARRALALYPSITSVEVVHVAPPDHAGTSIIDWMTPDEEAIEHGFHRVQAELSEVRALRIVPVLLRGVPARQVIKIAQSMLVDLLVTSTVGKTRVERFFVGSQARGIMRGAPCAVLVVPSRGPPET